MNLLLAAPVIHLAWITGAALAISTSCMAAAAIYHNKINLLTSTI